MATSTQKKEAVSIVVGYRAIYLSGPLKEKLWGTVQAISGSKIEMKPDGFKTIDEITSERVLWCGPSKRNR
jgi:hypothetical protein